MKAARCGGESMTKRKRKCRHKSEHVVIVS